MSDRYFIQSPVVADHAVLTGSEAHHLLHVMRAKAGTRVTLFDGSGWQFDALVQRMGRSEVELAIAGRQQIDREARVAVTLGVALPKGDRQKWLVEKLVELGVSKLTPLETDRGVAESGKGVLERLRRGVVEASKQCGRNRLMEVSSPMSWPAFLAEDHSMACRLVAHPGRGLLGLPVPGHEAVLAVGPEGGFTENEISAAVALGWQPIDLGPRILRVETAAIALSALVIGTS
jgi:16S rRNA (uracil1498-N3)-methyltransferase